MEVNERETLVNHIDDLQTKCDKAVKGLKEIELWSDDKDSVACAKRILKDLGEETIDADPTGK